LEGDDAATQSVAHGDDSSDLVMCPITGALMDDPVLAADGHTYERKAIEKLFTETSEGKEVESPVTRKAMLHITLTSNLVAYALVRKYKEQKST